MKPEPRIRFHRKALVTLVTGVVVASCTDSAAPGNLAEISFSTSFVHLDGIAPETVIVRNSGRGAAGPIALNGAAFTNIVGAAAVGLTLQVEPAELATLNPGDSAVVALRLASISPSVPDGTYLTTLSATVADSVRTVLGIGVRVTGCLREPLRVADLSGATSITQGDVVQFTADVRDSTGAVAAAPCVSWNVAPAGVGYVTADGQFVGYEPGVATIVATAGLGSDSIVVTIGARGLSGSFTTTGLGRISARYSSDLWVHGTVAYQGTWSSRNGNQGNTLYVWDVSDPTTPLLADSVTIDASTVNDVKVRVDGALAVVTHEGSSDGLNGVTLLDLADPLHPSVITRFIQSLESGVHNVWIDGDYLYVAVDGLFNGLSVLDITDPANPSIVASFYAGSSFLHDVYVRDGLAFLSHWDAGLVILDVGNGVAGGSPTNPVEVSRLAVAGGQTHNVWYWPAAGYAFVGEEDFFSPGIMHVVDVRDLSDPIEVGTYALSGNPPHNFWLDEPNGVLYLAWYGNGLVALDVTGDLLGELNKQGREYAVWQYGGSGGCPAAFGTATCTWAPQVHGGKIYVADFNTGLWVLDRVGF